jgi:hypothetical protein
MAISEIATSFFLGGEGGGTVFGFHKYTYENPKKKKRRENAAAVLDRQIEPRSFFLNGDTAERD